MIRPTDKFFFVGKNSKVLTWTYLRCLWDLQVEKSNRELESGEKISLELMCLCDHDIKEVMKMGCSRSKPYKVGKL